MTMPIQVMWDEEEHTTILWHYEGEWTWQESAQAAEHTRELRDTLAHLPIVAVILDMSQVETIPRDSLRNMRRLLQYLRANDLVILCGDNATVDVMAAFMHSTFPDAAERIRTTESLASARTLAREQIAGSSHDLPTRPRRPQTPPP